MPIFMKSQKKQSSRTQIGIEGAKEGVLCLPKNRYRMVLHISSVNFELKSEAEQDAIIETYQSFLNSLSSPIQILVRVRELDMDKYIEDFTLKQQHETEVIYKEQITNYTQFVRTLVTNNKILTRQFYVVVPHASDDKDFTVIYEQLTTSAELVAKGLARLGMQARKLDNLEILDLFYSFYSPKQAKLQPLTKRTMRALTESYL